MESRIYHAGEIAAQMRAGERTMGERNGRIITDKIIPGAVKFIENQPFFIASIRSIDGEVFTSIISGETGLIKVTGESNIEIDTLLVTSNPLDIFWKTIKDQDNIGMLFIESASRRRFRVNGRLTVDGDKLKVQVHQSYPNCPKYIQQRQLKNKEKANYTAIVENGNSFTTPLRKMIKHSDTFFVGSSSPEGDMDASHRGGQPGFIDIVDDDTLIIPDYAGNGMFNTLGNFMNNPKAGLLFIDFEGKRTLQLTGEVEIVWEEKEESENNNNNRYWKFKMKQWLLMENLKGFDWDFISYSPFNPSM
jgi:uncharacterized protein